MTVLHSGTTKKYSEQWSSIFGDANAKKNPAASKKKTAPKKSPTKKSKKKA